MTRRVDTGSYERLRGDQGVVVVEFALALPFILILVLGLIDYGMLWREANVVERSLANAGRVGANLADSPLTDYEVLRSIDASLGNLDRSDITRVIIFKSTSADGTVPASCLGIAATGTGAKGIAGTGGVYCNVYSPEQVAEVDPTQGFSPGDDTRTSCSGGWDAAWCPFSRVRALPKPDYIGVFVEVHYNGLTGSVPGADSDLQRTVVLQLEPAIAL